MKRFISLLLCFMMLFSLCTINVYGAEKPIKVKLCNYVNPDGKWVDSKYIKFDVDPVIIDGRTMVPIRAIAEELGWKVKWQGYSEGSGKALLTRNVPSGFDFNSNPQLNSYVYNMRKKIDGKVLSTYGDEVVALDRKNISSSAVETPYNIDSVLYSGKKIYFTVTVHVSNEKITVPRGNASGKYIPNDFYAHVFNADNETELDYSYGTSGDVQPQIIDGRTLIPLRQLAEVMGLTVSWDDATRTVTITA